MIKYLDEEFDECKIVKYRKPPAREYGRNQDGYGTKIVSDYMVSIRPSCRLYRVYVTQISNAGSAWCVIGGIKYHFRDCDFMGVK